VPTLPVFFFLTLVFEVLVDAAGGCVTCAKMKPGTTAVRIAVCTGAAIAKAKRPTVISDPTTRRDMKAASNAFVV
jgi:hypothetical protein